RALSTGAAAAAANAAPDHCSRLPVPGDAAAAASSGVPPPPPPVRTCTCTRDLVVPVLRPACAATPCARVWAPGVEAGTTWPRCTPGLAAPAAAVPRAADGRVAPRPSSPFRPPSATVITYDVCAVVGADDRSSDQPPRGASPSSRRRVA